MINKLFADWTNRILLLIVLLLGFYVIFRGISLSFTHDESLSFSIIQGNTSLKQTANHHALNTMLMDVCFKLFGSQEWALRLPNIIAFFIYSLAAFLVTNLITEKTIRVFAFVVLLFNPFLLDFFSLARGYGISNSCILLAFYFLLRHNVRDQKLSILNIDFLLCMLSATASMFSILSSINIYIALLGIFVIRYMIFFLKNRQSWNRGILLSCVIFFLALVPLYFGVETLLVLKDNNELYYGSNSLISSINALIYASMYHDFPPKWVSISLRYAILAIFLISFVFLVFYKKRSERFLLISCLNILVVIGFFIEHYFFDAKYPQNRTALMFIPMIACQAMFLFNEINTAKFKWVNVFIKMISVFAIILLSYNLIINLNLKKTLLWSYDASTKEVAMLIDYHSKGLNRKAVISNRWLFEPTLNYYITSRELNIEPASRNPLNCGADFILDFNPNCPDVTYDTLLFNNDNGVVLLKKR
ncbi:MAG: hypothetical protein GX587_11410 [Bacteroidales bacterium]|nr:hypothetical protein [Bacteroidales bacterium]